MTIPTTTANADTHNECIEVEAISTSKNDRIQNATKINVRTPNIAMIVPRGYKLRDEFVCPITKELIADPVIAADGHTYDRRAIEEWFYGLNSMRNNNSVNNNVRRMSPKTGEPLDHVHLIPNHNLKRLLGDMIREGGEGLYCPEDGSVVMKNTNSSVFSVGNMSSTIINGVGCSNSSRLSNSMKTTVNQQSNSRSISSPPSTVVLGGNNNGLKNTLSNMNISTEDENVEGVEIMASEEEISSHKANQKNKDVDTTMENNSTDKGPRLALVRELVLTAKCLGPPESDWNGRSFRLSETSSSSANEYGCIQGGRRRPNENVNNNNNNIEFVQFSDATVSRKHFEIRFLDEEMLDDVDICNTSFVTSEDGKNKRLFCLRDLGSAGGTFVRIPPGKGLSLYPGSMIMLGKHQFVVQEDASANDSSNNQQQQQEDLSEYDFIPHSDPKTTPKYGEDCAFFGNNSVNNESHSHVIKENDSYDNNYEMMDDNEFVYNDILDQQQRQHTVEDLVTSRNSTFHGCSAVPCFLTDTSSILSPRNSQIQSPSSSTQHNNIHNQLQLHVPTQKALLSSNKDEEQQVAPSIYLKCFAPEGTPIQNKQYNITKQNGMPTTLGRKQGNTISFSHRITNASTTSPTNASTNSPRYSFVGIDSSISGEHATIQYCEEKNILQLYDGVNGKSSTNGTWLRLSPMYKESSWFPLLNKTEILIGTIRFQICIEEVVVERDIYD